MKRLLPVGEDYFRLTLVVFVVSSLGLILTLEVLYDLWHPNAEEDVTGFRWLTVLGGVLLTGFLVANFLRMNQEMRRHAAARLALTGANRALRLMERCHKLVSREKNEITLLTEACTMLVEVGGYRFAWFGFVANKPDWHIIPVANSRIDDALTKALQSTWLESGGGQEPARTALRSLAPATLENLKLEDPGEAHWREQALRFGYACSLAIPMLRDGVPFGVLNLYAADSGAFGDAELALLEELAETLTFGVLALRESKRRKKAEKDLANHRHVLEEQVAKRTRVLNTVAAIAQGLLFQERWRDNIDQVLKDLGQAANVSRAYLFQADADADGHLVIALSHEWSAFDIGGGQENGSTASRALELYSLERWRARLMSGEALFGRTREFPEEERAFLSGRGILSIALMPILVNEQFWGLLGFEDFRRERTWSSGEINAMQLAASTLDAAIRKERLLGEKRVGEARLQQLSTAVEQSPNIVLITDAHGRIEYVNQQFTLITGFDAHEAIGSTPIVLRPEAKPSRDYLEMWQTLNEGRAWREEFQHTRRDGSQYWVHASVSPLVNESGEITHFVCIQEDVSHRKQSELQLRNAFDKLARSENRLQAILDNMPSIVFLKDVSGRYVLANRLFVESFHLDAPAILGHRDEELLPQDLARSFAEADQDVLQRGLSLDLDMTIPLGGEQRIFHMVRFPVVADDSGYFSICGIFTDITERKIAQARLLRSKQAQDILNGLLFSAMGHARTSLSGFIQESLGRILSAPWFIPMGRGAICLFGAEEDGSDVVCQVRLDEKGLEERLVRARGETFRGVWTPGIHFVQSREWPGGVIPGLPPGWGYYAAPLMPGGRVMGVMQIHLPPTHARNKDEEDFLIAASNTLASIVEKKIVDRQLILAKESAESASLAKSTFLANMSHEVRTPMNGIIGMLELLGKTRMTPVQRQYLSIATQSAELQMSVINDILDFSKIEAGKLVLESIPFDLPEIVENVGVMLSGAAHNKGLELTVSISGRIQPNLVGDAVRLRQVLINLAGNAIKFTRVGEVTIRADLVEEDASTAAVRFHVIDTGIGISPEAREKLFQPFVQADDSTTRRFGGTGLGLVIAKQIVESMGGRLGLSSQPGGGSIFWFEVAFAKAGETRGVDIRELRELRLLIVDDNDTCRTILENQCIVWEIPHVSVDSAGEALRTLREEGEWRANVAIVDMQMPEMDGLELAKAIRRDASIPPLEVILLSSGVHPEESMLAEARIDAYIMKPVGPTRLLDALRQLANRNGSGPRMGLPGPAGRSARQFRGRILLVEDTFVNQQVAAGMLKQLGLEVEIAGDGREGVAKAMAGGHDVILMDMQMPVMDGLEATERIRAWERLEGREPVPVVAMTANAMSGDRERCLEAGMNDYLSKPVLWDALVAKLAQWLPVQGAGGGTAQGGAASAGTESGGKGENGGRFLDGRILEGFWEAMKGVPGTFTLVIEEFLSGTPALLEEIRRGAEDGAPDRVRAAAHALKSNSATVGALALSTVCQGIEKAARQGNTAVAMDLIGAAREAFQAAVPPLREALSRETPPS